MKKSFEKLQNYHYFAKLDMAVESGKRMKPMRFTFHIFNISEIIGPVHSLELASVTKRFYIVSSHIPLSNLKFEAICKYFGECTLYFREKLLGKCQRDCILLSPADLVLVFGSYIQAITYT